AETRQSEQGQSSAGLYASALARHRAQGPLYRQLSQALAELIGTGVLPPGATLPAERELAQMTGLSRVTVRRAVQSLARSGKVIQLQGSGTYVAPDAMRMEQSMQHLSSFTDDMHRRGLSPRSVWLSRGLFPPTSEELMTLGLSVTEQVARLARLRLADDRPMAIERATLPATLLPDPQAVGASLYDHLTAIGVRPVRAVQRVTAANATPGDAEKLEVLGGAAVLRVERVSYLASGRVVEFTRSLYRGDRYDFVAEMK
ncbi:hypothetical protein LCGC14_2943870, partial [marine sediment metagenome]